MQECPPFSLSLEALMAEIVLFYSKFTKFSQFCKVLSELGRKPAGRLCHYLQKRQEWLPGYSAVYDISDIPGE